MDYIRHAIDFILHLDQSISLLIEQFGSGATVILFVVIFCETGLIITPFLPGDSLLFAVGAFSAKGDFSFLSTALILSVAAVVGDSVNYGIGKIVGPKIFHFEKSLFFKKKYLEKAHSFYERHGGKTIIIARFVPIIRTFAPFVAGIGAMDYRRFLFYNISGALAWVFLFTGAGYLFGNLSVVKNNFTLVIMVIIIISILPGIYEYIKVKNEEKNS